MVYAPLAGFRELQMSLHKVTGNWACLKKSEFLHTGPTTHPMTTEKRCCKVTDANRCTCNSSDKEAKICTVSLRAAGVSAPPTEWSITCETRNTESFSTLGKASKRSHLSFVKALRGYFHFFSLMRKLLSGVQCSRRLVELVVVTACYIWYDLKITVK